MRPRTKTTNPSVLSNAVKELRELMELTQQQFAQMLGVTLTTVARWETFRNPNGPMLLKLRAVSSTMADAAASPDVREKFLDIDDVLYSAILQESTAHRFGLAATVTSHAYDAIEKLSPAFDATSDERIHDGINETVKHLQEIIRLMRMLEGIKFRLPHGIQGADQLARVIVPDILSGMPQYSGLTDEKKAAEAEVIARSLARKKTVKRKAT